MEERVDGFAGMVSSYDRAFEAGGGGVKYTDLNTSYWKEHFAGFGRVTPS